MIALALVATLNCGATATQIDLDQCAAQRLALAAAAEQRAYAHAGTSFRDSEALWRAARDTACAFDTAGTTGGSIEPMIWAQCRAASTEERTRVLGAQLVAHCIGNTPSIQAAEAERVRVYGLLELLQTPAERTLLAASEEAWQRYRNAVLPLLDESTAVDVIHARTQELKDSWLADPFWK